VLEVETPLLSHTSVTDPHIHSMAVCIAPEKKYYLQTSPEYAMKRLLAAGSGPIYQITKAFRQEEIGRLHNPEFTLLEWYRPQFNHHTLMDEVDELLQIVLHTAPAKRVTYAEIFQTILPINPHQASIKELADCAKQQGIMATFDIKDRDTWLQLLMSHCIEPLLGSNKQPHFVYDFPASQAALARILPTHPAVAARFEVYVEGIELANGFYELQDVFEQRQRFENNLRERKSMDLEEITLDEYLLAALTHGLPDCAGVALGLDRLIMLAAHASEIKQVLSFDFTRA